MKVAILGVSFGSENLGVGALAAGAVTAILEGIPNVTISLLRYSRQVDTHQFLWKGKPVEVPTLPLRMNPFVANNVLIVLGLALVIRSLPAETIRRYLVSKNKLLQHINSCYTSLSVAGGDSFSDIYGLRVLVNVCMPQALALLMGRRLVQLPQTIGPFNTWIGRWLGSQILRRSAVILSRDKDSIEEIESLPGGEVLAARTEFCWDVGFLVEPSAGWPVEVEGVNLTAESTGPVVGVNVSGLLHGGGLRGGDEFKCRDAYREMCERLIPFLSEEHGATVVLIPHVHGEHISMDTWICRQVYEEASVRCPGRVGFAQGRYSAAEIKPLLGRCDLVVAGRMHACIGALSMGTPAVGVAYSRKFKGVFESLGLGEWVIDPRTMGVEEMLNTLGQCLAKRAEIRARLADVMPKVKREIVEKIAAAVLG